jgi:hypothetical protein
VDLPLELQGLQFTGKFNQEPHYFKKFEFSRQKKGVHFLPFEQKMCNERTHTLSELFSKLSFFNEKLILKRIGGKFELLEIQVDLFQKPLFLHQLTHNMTKDCLWN